MLCDRRGTNCAWCWSDEGRRLTEQIFEPRRGGNTLTVVRVQLVSALGSAHGVLGFAHVASHVSVRVVLDEQLAGLGVCGQRWEVTQVQVLCYSTEVDLSVVYSGISFSDDFSL